MYPTRTERHRAEQNRRRRRRRWIMVILASLVAPLLAVGSYYMDGNAKSGTHSAPKSTPHSGDVTAGSGSNPPSPADPNSGLAKTAPAAVRLTFVGDTMMSGRVETLLKHQGYDYPYTHVRSIFQQDDVTVANLETPVTKQGKPASSKAYVYKSPPEAIPALKAAGVDLVNLANNHSMDQGEAGLIDTFRVLKQNGLAYVGAGPDANRAYAPVYVERNGVRMAFLGFSRVVPEVSWYAGKNKPGVAATYDPTRALASIREARKQADLVVVLAHWGKERHDHPVDHQKTLAHAYIDAGADLVIGSHPHVLQGLESYKQGWIAYSLGNFVFTRSLDPKTWDTAVLEATCEKDRGCRLRMLPYRAELARVVPVNEAERAKLLKRVESLSTNVRIEPDGTIHPHKPAQP